MAGLGLCLLVMMSYGGAAEEKVRVLEDMLRKSEAVSDTCSATVTSLETQMRSLERLCDARVQVERTSCSCPPKWARYAALGGVAIVGGLAGRGSCVLSD
jgi:hypothetical protein